MSRQEEVPTSVQPRVGPPRPAEPTVEARLGELDALRAEVVELRARVARVRSMRRVATDGKVTVTALDWALDG